MMDVRERHGLCDGVYGRIMTLMTHTARTDDCTAGVRVDRIE